MYICTYFSYTCTLHIHTYVLILLVKYQITFLNLNSKVFVEFKLQIKFSNQRFNSCCRIEISKQVIDNIQIKWWN